MTLDPIAKAFIVGGILSLIIGFLWQMGWIQNIHLGRLPGDILIERKNVKFYFPLTSGLLISAIASLILWFFRRAP